MVGGETTFARTSDVRVIRSGGGETVVDEVNLNAIRAAHDRLDELLKRPRAEWPRAELFREAPRGR